MTQQQKVSQADVILALLSDRQWHTTHEIGAALFEQLGTGGVIHSRINDLRWKRGHFIRHETVEGESGAHAHRYLLVATADELSRDAAPASSAAAPAAADISGNSPAGEPDTSDVDVTSAPASLRPGWLARELQEDEEREQGEPPPGKSASEQLTLGEAA